MLTKFVRCLVA